jgi:enoyl-CoA hydratase
MPDTSLVSLERDGAVALLTFQRAEKLNALDAAMVDAIDARLDELEADGEVRCAILTGAGKAFVAGADIAAMASLSPTEAKRFADRGQALGARLESLPFPVIAAVNGFALGGGCELALACDFIWASDKARFGQPEVNLGVIPGFGGTQRLARRVGIGRARELVYTGAMISAEQARAIGLCNEVVPADTLIERVKEVARTIAGKGPLAIAAAKRVTLRGEGESLGAACELEAQAFAGLFGSADQREGMKAFLEKRAATFTGR